MWRVLNPEWHQTVVLHHYQDPRGTHAGLTVSDRPADLSIADAFRELGLELPVDRSAMGAAVMTIPEEERQSRLAELFGGAPRVFVGTTHSGDATLHLRDARGRPRIELGVPADGDPLLRILNEDGSVAWELGMDGGAGSPGGG